MSGDAVLFDWSHVMSFCPLQSSEFFPFSQNKAQSLQLVEVQTQTFRCQGIWRPTRGLDSGSSEGTELCAYPGARLTFACFSPRIIPSPCTSSRAGGTNAWHIMTFLST